MATMANKSTMRSKESTGSDLKCAKEISDPDQNKMSTMASKSTLRSKESTGSDLKCAKEDEMSNDSGSEILSVELEKLSVTSKSGSDKELSSPEGDLAALDVTWHKLSRSVYIKEQKKLKKKQHLNPVTPRPAYKKKGISAFNP